jgi:hypothetical protein
LSQLTKIDWIDVNDRVPSDARYVLCFTVDGFYSVGKMTGRGLWRNCQSGMRVTHWAHLHTPTGNTIPYQLSEAA